MAQILPAPLGPENVTPHHNRKTELGRQFDYATGLIILAPGIDQRVAFLPRWAPVLAPDHRGDAHQRSDGDPGGLLRLCRRIGRHLIGRNEGFRMEWRLGAPGPACFAPESTLTGKYGITGRPYGVD